MITYKGSAKVLHRSNLIYRRNVSSVNNKWQSVVGLEVHAQLNTESKLFSGAQHSFGNVVNKSVSLFDAAIPGTLPVLNRKCVELGILTATALSCNINEVSSFDRKHYFYADMPAGYQITQQRAPLASDGIINFQVLKPTTPKEPYRKSSKIKQIQLEQDSGKSFHDEKDKISLVDLNRMGAPLVEIVFEPDLEDGEEAAALVRELVLILQTIKVCSGKMELGALRVDANVSLRRPGDPLSTRTEIKNISSVRAVAKAVQYEINRQRELLEAGGRVVNETLSWDAPARATVVMRDKEVVQDYRFMPEPNLLPLRLNLKTKVDTHDVISVPLLIENMPELPEVTRTKLVENYSTRADMADTLINEPILLNHFKVIVKDTNRDPLIVARILLNTLGGVLFERKLDIRECDITVDKFKDITDLVMRKEIDFIICKDIIEELIDNPNKTPQEILKEKDWIFVNDEKEIAQMCQEVINELPKIVNKYKKTMKRRHFHTLLVALEKSTNKRLDIDVSVRVMKELLEK